MEPATSIIKAFGGTRAVSELTGVHIAQVSKWRWSKERGGTDGLIPMKHSVVLLREARVQNIDVKPEDFFPDEDAKTEQAVT
ncbi:hypothetical protein JQX09_17915 [Sulfitobacter pseudonitzschiae]|uniref:Uncharacterized protein n=1 Tax=Pseudosulfitobacter pseudonitzschiae TaxID=1402135 RepID=A0A9Q2NWJ8_9RHOB|nr:hypothetical protein [Pseudosulfitobacter pseudonitzschiae]MBM2293808.1 hypothetical protein [Pseudosulfitobacter pseudonitzschiae]MBM2298725.1 hypothetical protein [Pseudosulfitobacter pseudonitzschiae]MBM2303640.1 hypothetical protein [Pseudosulfitobacter pseudonitzschiae]MBM2313422.1 hypothetical protein [Pseudosulfitobacter pseudonitzschiae]MBM2318336.1 hypothetical protein [Pseudosulfitobacter pseudonitzschiae]